MIRTGISIQTIRRIGLQSGMVSDFGHTLASYAALVPETSLLYFLAYFTPYYQSRDQQQQESSYVDPYNVLGILHQVVEECRKVIREKELTYLTKSKDYTSNRASIANSLDMLQLHHSFRVLFSNEHWQKDQVDQITGGKYGSKEAYKPPAKIFFSLTFVVLCIEKYLEAQKDQVQYENRQEPALLED